MGSINFARALRAAMVTVLALNLVLGVALAATGHVALINFGAALFMVGWAAVQTGVIRRMEKREGARGSLPVALLRVITGRRRPDYARIRELEIECELRGGQCTVTRPNGLCCIREKHDDEWHRDGRGEPWRETPLRLIRVKPKVTGRKSVRIHGDAAAYWAYRNHED